MSFLIVRFVILHYFAPRLFQVRYANDKAARLPTGSTCISQTSLFCGLCGIFRVVL